MSRQVFRLALLGLAVLPTGSAALGCPPLFFRPYYLPPIAVPYYVPQPYYVVPAPQYQPYPPPRVRVEPSKPAEFARPEPAKPDAVTPRINPVAPATQTPPSGIRPAEFKSTDSTPLAAPRPATPDIAVPGLKIDPPAGAASKGDAPQLPAPVPSSAKEPEGVKIPPVVPPLKGVPDPTVPPLAIPTPADPRTSTSKSSPLADRPRVEVVPADGAPPADLARRSVGFFNQSDRDVRLTVEGRTITLPRRHYVTAVVPATFGWKLDDGPAEQTAIPTAAPGVEVVIRR